jgi:hypothetical protein
MAARPRPERDCYPGLRFPKSFPGLVGCPNDADPPANHCFEEVSEGPNTEHNTERLEPRHILEPQPPHTEREGTGCQTHLCGQMQGL